MSDNGTERRLTTILAADVVGYSRLMAADEAGTLAQLKVHRKDLIEPKTAEYHGRVVKLMGDGTLMEFGSVVDAVNFAADLQRAVAERNAGVREDRRIAYRIGINIGDVIIDGDDIYGDGVNIAARLEGLAEPGGICVTRNVYDQVKGKVDTAFEDLGARDVKNIPEPVRVFKVLLDVPASDHGVVAALRAKRSLRRPAVAAGLAILIIAAGTTLWLRPWAPDVEPAAVERMAFPLPDKPSIAVLPFDNLSDDPEQEYFADGMTDDLITDLSKISGLFVIARNSSFSYKGQQVKVRQVAQDLGVRYVLEGSVRRAGDQLRINAQLIDATTGGHVWAERYDGALDEVFALQDKVTRQIVTALAVNLTAGEQLEWAEAKSGNPEAYDAYLRGWAHYRRNTHDDYAKARQYFERAIEIDPDYSQALAALAATYWESYYRDWFTAMKMDRVSTKSRAKDYLEMALVNPTPLAFQVSSKMLVWRGEYEKAIAEARKAIALDPSNADSRITLAETLIWNGSPREVLDLVEWARRVDPHNEAYHAYVEGLAEFALEQFQSAAASFERALDLNPKFLIPAVPLAATYAHLDRHDDARDVIRPYCKEADCHAAGWVAAQFPFRGEKDQQRFVEGLVQAGLPE